MYTATLWLHSLLRYFVLIALIAAAVASIAGVVGKREWMPWNKGINIAVIAGVHTQVVIGLLLYVGVSPIMGQIFEDFGGAMKNGLLRFWAVEHITLMLIGAIAAHVTHVLVKKAEEAPRKFKRGAIGFTFALVCILAAIPWPFREAVGRGWLPN